MPSISISLVIWVLLNSVLCSISASLCSLEKESVSKSVEPWEAVSGFNIKYANSAMYSVIRGKIRSPERMLAALGIFLFVIHPSRLVPKK